MIIIIEIELGHNETPLYMANSIEQTIKKSFRDVMKKEVYPNRINQTSNGFWIYERKINVVGIQAEGDIKK